MGSFRCMLVLALLGSALWSEPSPAADLGKASAPNIQEPPSGNHVGGAPKPTCEGDLVRDPAPAPVATDNTGPPKAGLREGAAAKMAITLDPETLWRPRGAEVRFLFSTHGASDLPIAKVHVEFSWSHGADCHRPGVDHDTLESPLVRNIANERGLVEYGAIVPSLEPASVGFLTRMSGLGGVDYTGLFTVPVAEMVVKVTFSDKTDTTYLVPVGVTSVPASIIVLIFCTTAAIVALIAQAPRAMVGKPPSDENWFGTASRYILAIIANSNGVASLSQLQILLWTFVVFGASVYVMVLSGNLIGISNGTLILLGIASVTSVLARTPSKAVAQPSKQFDKPEWWHLLTADASADNPEIDVTRVQMLIFTLVSAAFVAIKVAVDYEIPEVPENYLLLMGISNGVYLAGRQIPVKIKDKNPPGSP